MKFKEKASSLALSAVLLGTSIAPVSAVTKTEIIGANRYETAAKIADKMGNYDTAILVNADKSLADGLSASSLAGKENAPILLVKKDSIPAATMQRLRNVKRVYVIGGEAAVSQRVVDSLGDVTYIRIQGANRIETSENVAEIVGNYNKAFVVNGNKGEADAMSVASVAARDKAPIILTNGKSSNEVKRPGVKYYVVGGSAVVSNSLVNKFGAIRLSGSDRYKTNRVVVNKFYPNSSKLYFTKGNPLVDALTVSPLAKNDGVVLVSAKSDNSILNGKDTVQVGGMNFGGSAKPDGQKPEENKPVKPEQKPEENKPVKPDGNMNINSDAYQAEFREEFYKLIKSVSVRTVQATAPETPNYKLINTISEGTGKTNNIKDVKYPKITIPEGKENEKIEYGTGTDHIEISNKYAVVDNDYTTYWSVDDWDTGASYTNNRRGPIVEFDFLNKKEYKINKIAVVSRVDGKGNNPNGAKVFVYENGEANSKSTIHEASIQNYTDSKNSKYSIIKLNEPITVKEGNLVQVSLSTSSQANPKSTSIAELKFYEYDPIEDNIKDLFADDLHLVLKDDVTESKIALLRKELQKKDNGEYHPEKEALEKELDIALKLLKEANSLDKDVTTMDISINGGGTNTGYGNDWQALGLTAKAGDTIKVYVSKTIADGSSNREIYLGYEQNYAESGSYISKQIELKSGENIIQIDKLVSTDVEKGGNLYVRIGGQPDTNSETVKIRVSGAEKIPHLNLNNKLINVNELVNKKDSDDVSVKEIKEELKTYIKELKNHVDNLPKKHKQSNIKHEEVGDKDNIYDYNPRTSILNSTNIEGDRFTLTIPATQAYKGLGLSNLTDENIDEKVDKLYDTMLAWEQLIQITNAKKGVLEKDNGSGIYANNKASRQRVNVKYQRMFGSAFMYASGHHVGVEYDSTSDFMNGVPYKFKDGKVTNPGEGYLFGWGISHEIGHKADIGDRTYGETSNNILALMTQTFDGVSKSRLELNNIYPKIYKKVTSATEGVAQDVATLLGMFWQLHLAYEPGYTYEILDRNNDKDLTNDSYYTKMNRLYRNRTAEEKTIKDKDQLLIVMASKAAGKDLTDFFDSWGIKITSETKDILDKLNLPKEERKIQYLNDEAYRKRLAGVGSISKEDTKVVASFKDESIKNTVLNSNSVTLSLNIDNEKNKDKILGYEIIRNDGNTQGNENEGTKVNYRSVGFVNANEDGSAEFTDNISPMNNRAVTYKVKAYDYNLNYTKEYEVGSVKLSHDGTLDSSKFLLKSNLISEELIPNEDGEVSNSIDQNSELAWKNNDALAKMTDGKNNTAFRGKRMTYNAFDNSAGSSNEDKIDINADPYVIFDLQGSKTICGFKYTKSDNAVSRFSLKRLVNAVKGNTTYNPISQYRMYISNDGKNWTEINKTKDGKPNEFKFGGSNTTKVIFEKEDKNIRSYEAKYVKLVAVGAKDSYLDIAEISLLGSTGDNIEIQKDGIGKLKEDFVYQKQNEEGGLKEATIPAGSIIITGEYKGNPGFNIPLLIDDDNKTINGEAIMMAELSDEGEVGEIYSGRWIYWVSENDLSKLSSKVKAELYRYNGLDEDDNVSEEQRLVSDTLYNTVPSADKLPTIELKSEVQRMARKSSKQNNVTYIDMRNSNSNK